jgi:hypothetical protein
MKDKKIYELFKRAYGIGVPGVEDRGLNVYLFRYKNFGINISSAHGEIKIDGFCFNGKEKVIRLEDFELEILLSKVLDGIEEWIKFLEEENFRRELEKKRRLEIEKSEDRKFVAESLERIPVLSTTYLK